MTEDERSLHTDDLHAIQTDVLLALPHTELETHLREARSTIDNAQLIHDRLRAVRIEKIRQQCIHRMLKESNDGA